MTKGDDSSAQGSANNSSLSKMSEHSTNGEETEAFSTDGSNKAVNELDQDDASYLRFSRTLVLCLLTIMAVVSGSLVFFFTTKGLKTDFENQVSSSFQRGVLKVCVYFSF